MGWDIVKSDSPRIRQLARRIGFADKDGGYHITGFTALIPSLYDTGYTLYPWHSHRIARDINKHNVLVNLGQGFYELVLLIRHTIILTVVTLAILIFTLIETAEN